VGSDDDNRDISPRLLQRVEDLPTVDAWQSKVEYHQVGDGVASRFQSVNAVGGVLDYDSVVSQEVRRMQYASTASWWLSNSLRSLMSLLAELSVLSIAPIMTPMFGFALCVTHRISRRATKQPTVSVG
jgi:hypothetical protein